MHNVEIENLEYDYIPGERQSRRCWQIVLRRPIDDGIIRRRMILKLNVMHKPKTIIPDDRYFRVDDIHGRRLIVVPLSEIDLRTPINIGLTNLEPHGMDAKMTYRHRPVVYGHGLHHPRMGVELYDQRPDINTSSFAYISFPVV